MATGKPTQNQDALDRIVAEARRNADSANELRLNIKLKSARGEPATGVGTTLAMDEMSSVEDERKEELRKQAERRRELEEQELAKLQQAKQPVP